MFKRMNLGLAGVLALLLQLFLAGSAWAHHPLVTATASCAQNGSPVIQYTATSWQFGSGHPQIQIQFNSVSVSTGAFTAANNYSFTGTLPAPAGAQVTVTALALGTWDSGVAGGQSASVVVTIPTNCAAVGTGRFTGGGKQVRVGEASVTRGLTIHCDLLLSNNLEVNWGGNRFQMTTHMTTVACTDDPLIIQSPPAAPLDTLIGIGTGRYNGADGYTIEFTLVDAGEPGALDKMAIRIFETANSGNVVLYVPLQFMTTGNLQAHYDQPHKK